MDKQFTYYFISFIIKVMDPVLKDKIVALDEKGEQLQK